MHILVCYICQYSLDFCLAVQVRGIWSYCTVAHWYQYDFTIDIQAFTLIPSARVWKLYILQVTQICKYFENMTTGNEKVKKFLLCLQSVNH